MGFVVEAFRPPILYTYYTHTTSFHHSIMSSFHLSLVNCKLIVEKVYIVINSYGYTLTGRLIHIDIAIPTGRTALPLAFLSLSLPHEYH